MKYIKLALLFLIALPSCVENSDSQQVNCNLPILGNRDFAENGDTLYHTVGDFSFINQDSVTITNKTFEGKAYVSDFFFIHCPTICPKVTKSMLRVYEEFKDNDNLLLLAHTLDPKRDTIGALKRHADNLEVKSDKWHFATGDKDELHGMADDYFSIAYEDSDAPGGFNHSGLLILVDKNRNVRAHANGTEAEEVTRFLEEIKCLLKEDYLGS